MTTIGGRGLPSIIMQINELAHHPLARPQPHTQKTMQALVSGSRHLRVVLGQGKLDQTSKSPVWHLDSCVITPGPAWIYIAVSV